MSRHPFIWPSPYDVLTPCDFVLPGQSPPAEPPSFPPRPIPNKPPRRRGLLGAVAALALVPVAAKAAPITDPDAEIIRGCARYLELERIMEDPLHPEHEANIEDRREWPEYEALEETLADSEPQTREGMAAIASVALLCDAAIESDTWASGEEGRLAWKVLAYVAGPQVAAEAERRMAERAERKEESWRRLDALVAEREADEAKHAAERARLIVAYRTQT